MSRHHMSGTPTYSSWKEMKYRCNHPNKRKHYTGIEYCEDWESFDRFYADMGERPIGTTLDRIDCCGNYEPSNCRWADAVTQANNKRNNRYFLYNGENLTLPQIARKYKISRSNLQNKVYLDHKTVNDAVGYLLMKKRRKEKGVN